ncbi:unnamed protein product [Protopolystoma xenopodis]|uniref:Uncharacterized protein n=1 Tax=Protopolystoma xenopodis TaxID=117903 RepID=A0A3S5AXS8_9PLAT|nr:unnamed protein product [Protopolystoma xenopodis]
MASDASYSLISLSDRLFASSNCFQKNLASKLFYFATNTNYLPYIPFFVSHRTEQVTYICRTLRLLNSLAVPWIGIALTWTQYQALGPSNLLDRLLHRNHYPIALEFLRLLETVNPKGSANQHTSKFLSAISCNNMG